MAAPCVSIELSLKSGDTTNLKRYLATNDGKISHQSLINAISSVKVELNDILTLQVEQDKQESAQLKKSGGTLNAKTGSAGTTGAAEADKAEGGKDPDDTGLEEDDDDDGDKDDPNTTDCGDQTNKREANNQDSSSSKKSKLSDS